MIKKTWCALRVIIHYTFRCIPVGNLGRIDWNFETIQFAEQYAGNCVILSVMWSKIFC